MSVVSLNSIQCQTGYGLSERVWHVHADVSALSVKPSESVTNCQQVRVKNRRTKGLTDCQRQLKSTFEDRNRPNNAVRFLSLEEALFWSETPLPVTVSSSNTTSCGGMKPLLYLEMTICESYNSTMSICNSSHLTVNHESTNNWQDLLMKLQAHHSYSTHTGALEFIPVSTGWPFFFNNDFPWLFHDQKMNIHDLSAQQMTQPTVSKHWRNTQN